MTPPDTNTKWSSHVGSDSSVEKLAKDLAFLGVSKMAKVNVRTLQDV